MDAYHVWLETQKNTEFCCRLCGCENWGITGSHFFCRGCSAVFCDIEAFSSVPTLEILYLGNYDKEEWGELGFTYEGDSGFDLRAAVDESVTLYPNDKPKKIPTGVAFNIPCGYEIEIRPRSGLGGKKAVTFGNAPGTIDHQYTGEVMAFMINLNTEPYTIEPGERIVQACFRKVPNVQLKETDMIRETDRGSNGFGSTGRL